MRITGSLTDVAVLTELGARIAGRRIEFQLTQAAVAEQAGIAKRTLERMEAGQTSQLATLIRVLRVLEAASGLDSLIPESDGFVEAQGQGPATGFGPTCRKGDRQIVELG